MFINLITKLCFGKGDLIFVYKIYMDFYSITVSKVLKELKKNKEINIGMIYLCLFLNKNKSQNEKHLFLAFTFIVELDDVDQRKELIELMHLLIFSFYLYTLAQQQQQQ